METLKEYKEERMYDPEFASEYAAMQSEIARNNRIRDFLSENLSEPDLFRLEEAEERIRIRRKYQLLAKKELRAYMR